MISRYFALTTCLLLGPIMLGIIIFITKAGFVYDEPWYYENIISLSKLGLSYDFILHLKGPPGPLHAIIYYPLYKIFGLNIHLFRFYGLVLSILSLYLLSQVRINGLKIGWDVSLIFACPVFYVVSGLALTEVPSLLFFSASLLILSKASLQNKSLLPWVLSGLLLSIAICGRQPAMMFTPAVVLSYIYIQRKELINKYRNLTKPILFSVSSCILPFILFTIWHGIVPKIGGADATRESFSLINGLLGLGYLVVFIFFLFPEAVFYEIKRKFRLLLVCLILISLANVFFFHQEFYFINSVVKQHLSPGLFKLYGLLGYSLLIVLSLLSLFIFKTLIIVNKENFFKLSCLLGLFFITITCAKVTHQFSSRYVYQGIFLTIPILAGAYQTSKISTMINAAGIIIGLFSYISYLSL